MIWSPLNVFLLLIFAAGVVATVLAIVVALARRMNRAARLLAAGLAGWSVIYLGTLLLVSFSSRELMLPTGVAKQFCGFYFDCHLSVRIINASTASTMGDGAARHTPKGVYYLLTVKVANDAQEATLSLYRPGVWIVDDQGRKFPPLTAAEGAISGMDGLSQPLSPRSDFPTVLVFDLPPDVKNPRLLVTEADRVWPDRLFEALLIGDEDSMLHAKTTLMVIDDSHDPIRIGNFPPAVAAARSTRS